MLKLSDRATSEDGVTRLLFWAVGFGGAAESSQKAHTPVSSFSESTMLAMLQHRQL